MVNANTGGNGKSFEEILKSVEERGTPAFEAAKKAILEENFQNKMVRRALDYYAHNLWFDVHHAGLLSLACEAVGGKPNETALIGAATILLRGGIDIHDDIIDRQEKKIDKLTVYGKYGASIAILAGNAMLFKGFTLLDEAIAPFSREKRRTIMDVVKNAFFEIGDAVANELEFRKNPTVAPDDYFNKVIKSKAVGVEAHMRIGAIIGGGTEEETSQLAQLGRTLGILTTIRDEIIDVYEPKELQDRLENEVPPLTILYALKDRQTKEKMKKILGKKRLTQADAYKILDVMVESREYQRLRKYLGKIVMVSLDRTGQFRNTEAKNILRYLLSMSMKDI